MEVGICMLMHQHVGQERFKEDGKEGVHPQEMIENLCEVDFVSGCHVECGACAHCVKAAALQRTMWCQSVRWHPVM